MTSSSVQAGTRGGFERSADAGSAFFQGHPAEGITVLLADDHMVVRQGLRKLLEAGSDIQVVGEGATGLEAVDMALKLRPAVVLMDISMPSVNGLEATRQILNAVPGARVLILSAHGDDAYVKSAMALGAAGYLIKQTSADLLCEAIREAHNGKTFSGPPSPSVPAVRIRVRRIGKGD